MIVQINSQITDFRKAGKFKFLKHKILVLDFSNAFHRTDFVCTTLTKAVFKKSLFSFTVMGIQGNCKAAYSFGNADFCFLFKKFLINQNPVFFYSTVTHKRTESSLVTKKIKGINPGFKAAEESYHFVIFKSRNPKTVFCKKFHHWNGIHRRQLGNCKSFFFIIAKSYLSCFFNMLF